MKYTKPPLSFSDQADLLISRGLMGSQADLTKCLESVNYYRLAGYLNPLRLPNSENFQPGTTFNKVWERYCFDRQLRILVLDGIERVEVALRTQAAYHLSHLNGPFGYLTETDLPNLGAAPRGHFLDKITDMMQRSSEDYIRHFSIKYGDTHSLPPLWMVVETMSFGQLQTLVRGVHVSVQKKIGSFFSISEKVLLNWIGTLNSVRNICAHHSRLWNRQLGYRPMIPHKNKYPDWHDPVPIADRVFCVLLILRFMLRVAAPSSLWHERVETLISNHPNIPLVPMGFPIDWKNHPVWA